MGNAKSITHIDIQYIKVVQTLWQLNFKSIPTVELEDFYDLVMKWDQIRSVKWAEMDLANGYVRVH